MFTLMFCLMFSELTSGPVSESPEAGLFVRSLWLVQQHGMPAAGHDEALKATLAKALAQDSSIEFQELGQFISFERFQAIAGPDDSIDASDITRQLAVSLPDSRAKLNAKLRSHADYLTTTFDMIDVPHRQASQQLAAWMVANYEAGKPLEVVVVCTGNSRRSIIGSSMGNLAADYYGLSDIRFYSGGTAPSAFNRRTMAALQDVGFEITETGNEATRGDLKTPNPIVRVQWGEGLESREFSKHFAAEGNPQAGFAALMVCSEADAECPTVRGAALRLAMPYLDPKIYDGSAYESAKYAERRDDIGRTLLAALCQVRRELNAK